MADKACPKNIYDEAVERVIFTPSRESKSRLSTSWGTLRRLQLCAVSSNALQLLTSLFLLKTNEMLEICSKNETL